MGLLSSRGLLRTASRIAIIAATGALSACSGASIFSSNNASATRNLTQPDNQDIVGGAAYWGAKYDANRGDTAAAVNFAKSLRMMGGAKQAVTLLKDVVMKAPDDPRVLSEYGKALTAVGRAKDALPFLSRAVQLSGKDWTAYSAYGVALDQTGDHAAARDLYQTALTISPNNPAIESNVAMSYVLDGHIAQGEAIMRKLAARTDATPQMRQNLAMVATLKGNKAEAEILTREDLTLADANNNLAVLRQFSADNAKPPMSAPSIIAPAAPAPIKAPAPSARKLPPPLPVPQTPKYQGVKPVNDQAPSETPNPQQQSAAPTNLVPQAAKTNAPTVKAPRAPVTMAPIADEEITTPPNSAKEASSPPAPLRQSLDSSGAPSSVAVATAAEKAKSTKQKPRSFERGFFCVKFLWRSEFPDFDESGPKNNNKQRRQEKYDHRHCQFRRKGCGLLFSFHHPHFAIFQRHHS